MEKQSSILRTLAETRGNPLAQREHVKLCAVSNPSSESNRGDPEAVRRPCSPTASQIFTLPNIRFYMQWGELSLDTLSALLSTGLVKNNGVLLVDLKKAFLRKNLNFLFSVIYAPYVESPIPVNIIIPQNQQCLTNDNMSSCVGVLENIQGIKGFSLTLIYPIHSFNWNHSTFSLRSLQRHIISS